MVDKKIAAWALYDLANTAFTSPFVTIFWPLLVTSFLGGNEFHIGITVAIGIAVFSLVVPVIGIYSDKTNIRKPFIVIPTFLMVLLIAILPLANLFWNLVLAGIATILYNLSLSIYNSLLPTLATDKEMGKISGLGMATGFSGTLLSLLVAYLTLVYFSSGTIETEKGIKAVFPVISAFFMIFSLPLFFVIKDENVKKQEFGANEIKNMFLGVVSNIKKLFKIKGMFPFLAYYMLFSNALAAIDIFFFLYAKKEIGMTISNFIFLFMGQSFGACFGAILFGRLSDRFGSKNTLKICTIIWIGVILVFISSRSMAVFWIAGLLGSIAFGGSLATSRSLFVFLTPKDKMGEYFGYSQIVSRLAALIGPVLGGWLIITYSYSVSLIMVFIFLVLCYIYLAGVPDLRSRGEIKKI